MAYDLQNNMQMDAVSNLLNPLSINTMSKGCKQFNHAVADTVYLIIFMIDCNAFHFTLASLFCMSSITIEDIHIKTTSVFREGCPQRRKHKGL